MISRTEFAAICCGLAAWFWCTAGAFAQNRPGTPPAGAGRSADVVVPIDFPWETVEWIERRHKIEARSFKARDETGVDWWGSDEVMIETVVDLAPEALYAARESAKKRHDKQVERTRKHVAYPNHYPHMRTTTIGSAAPAGIH